MRGRRELLWVAVIACAASPSLFGQSIRSLINGGNDLYDEKKFPDAEVNYRKALDKEQGLVQGHFNLGNALQKQGKHEDAVQEFQRVVATAEQRETTAFGYYNMGNAYFEAQQYRDAVNAYIEALKLNPEDQEAKYNLSLALKMLQQQEQQQGQKDQKNQTSQDRNKDQSQQKSNNTDPQQRDQQQSQQQKQQEPQPQAGQRSDKRMSRADAERILEVLKNSEREIQKKLRSRAAVRPKGEKDW